jgi:hypothetical protein
MADNITVTAALSNLSNAVVAQIPDWATALLALVSVVTFFCCAQTVLMCMIVPVAFAWSRAHRAFMQLSDPPEDDRVTQAPAARPPQQHEHEQFDM